MIRRLNAPGLLRTIAVSQATIACKLFAGGFSRYLLLPKAGRRQLTAIALLRSGAVSLDVTDAPPGVIGRAT